MKDHHFMKTSEYFKDIAHDHDCNPAETTLLSHSYPPMIQHHVNFMLIEPFTVGSNLKIYG